MIEIKVTINEHGEVYTSSDIIGYQGENNARVLVIDHPKFDNCTYELWIDTGNSSPYCANLINGKYTVCASILNNESVTFQWLALKGTALVAKSAKWNMKVLESLSGEPAPVPTYSQCQTLLQDLNEAIGNAGSSNYTAGRNIFISNQNVISAKTHDYIVYYYQSPTNEQIQINLYNMESFAEDSSETRAMYLKSGDTYIPCSYTNGSVFNFVMLSGLNNMYTVISFSGTNSSNYSQTITTHTITQNNFTTTYKNKLDNIENGAEKNTINAIKANGTALTIENKTVDIPVPVIKTVSLTIPANSWNGYGITVTAQGVTASNTVIVSPVPACQNAYSASKIICSAQGTNSLTFTCSTVPTNDIVVGAVIIC